MLENAILLIGLGTNEYEQGRVIELNDLAKIKEYYGDDSCFYSAVRTINKFANSPQIFLLNLDSWEQIEDLKEQLQLLQIDYIVPLNLYLDEKYIEPNYGKNITYTQTLLSYLSNTVSTVIMTGKHASGFENLDDFLNEEEERIYRATPEFYNINKENLIYVANNLVDIEFANAALAAVIINTDYAEYPSSKLLTEAVFDIDYSDITNNLVYFKNNHRIGTTIENLVNFSEDKLYKPFTVKRILKYFHYHKPDTDKYIGKAYNEYRKNKVVEILESYLDNLVGWIIYKYEILSATDISPEPGAVDILLKYSIQPKFTTERYIIET